MGNIRKFINSSPLYKRPSTLKGIARVIDLFGQLDHYHTKPTEEQADKQALKRDWYMVGRDIANALKTYGKATRTATAK